MRGTGQTKAMVEAIPNEGGFIVVHTSAMRSYVEEMIRDIRGSDMSKRCKILVVRDYRDLSPLAGRRGHVVVDHAALSSLPRGLAAELARYVEGINSTQPA